MKTRHPKRPAKRSTLADSVARTIASVNQVVEAGELKWSGVPGGVRESKRWNGGLPTPEEAKKLTINDIKRRALTLSHADRKKLAGMLTAQQKLALPGGLLESRARVVLTGANVDDFLFGARDAKLYDLRLKQSGNVVTVNGDEEQIEAWLDDSDFDEENWSISLDWA